MTGGTSREIWVIAEHAGGHFRPVTYEVASFARKLANAFSGDVWVLVLGESVAALCHEIAETTGSGALGVETPGYRDYQCEVYRSVVRRLCVLRETPAIILAAHTSTGLDLAPALAVDIQASCITGVCGLRDDNGPVFSRQIFWGKMVEELRPTAGRPIVATVAPGADKGDTTLPDRAGPVAVLELSPEAVKSRKIGRVPCPYGPAGLKDAEAIVAAGRGVGRPENLEIIRRLASVLPRCAVGASRPICDAGWLPHEHQVGMTGRSVSPRLYIACGISGSLQHVMGIGHPDLIVAINTDPNAPFCRIAHCCIVEDIEVFLPVLIGRINRLRQNL